MKPAARPIQRPPDGRLLIVAADGRFRHAGRAELVRWLRPGDLLVANDAATIPASLGGVHRPTGAAIEVRLAGRPSLDTADVRRFTAIVFGAGDYRMRTEDRPPPPALRAGDTLALGPLRASVVRKVGHPRLVELRFTGTADEIWAGISLHGRPIQYSHIDQPLSPWDVWSRVAGRPVAFEPPSASFILDWKLMQALAARAIAFATITLAAGISSTGDKQLDGRLPLDEPYFIPESSLRAIAYAQRCGGRVIAVGTTVTRALEHAASAAAGFRAGAGIATQRIGADTPLAVVDAIVTGTHEPGASHYEVLSAFASAELLARVTATLDRHDYRTHEFGDSLLIERSIPATTGAYAAPGSSRTLSSPRSAP